MSFFDTQTNLFAECCVSVLDTQTNLFAECCVSILDTQTNPQDVYIYSSFQTE
ncbi:hypothetical protein FHS18_004420 [Paenibacillus phyllosphaerae]|uniref:Uncharacterized protein n=1 Tax=Paenibacillus phyllosphaerae TaxID=274593 RepID=A0A7W5FPS8_9BACL|nr:hypothetical protein [Paenibacillus phyllosphaerae]